MKSQGTFLRGKKKSNVVIVHAQPHQNYDECFPFSSSRVCGHLKYLHSQVFPDGS
jgi:hypothetical protein